MPSLDQNFLAVLHRKQNGKYMGAKVRSEEIITQNTLKKTVMEVGAIWKNFKKQERKDSEES